MMQRFDALVRAGRIRPSVLWKSLEMNARIKEHAESIARKLDDYVYVDAAHGLGPFKSIQSALPLFGEDILYTDIMKTARVLRHQFAGPVQTMYGLTMGYNFNVVHPADTKFLDNHGVAHLLAAAITFFTGDNKAAGYGNDLTIGLNGLRATENMTEPDREPNAGWRMVAGNDCEDFTAKILFLAKGVLELDVLRREDPDAYAAVLALPVFDNYSPREKEGFGVFLERAWGLLEPFREGLGNPSRPMPAGDAAFGARDRIDITNVLGVALGASTDNPTGSYGGHSFAQMLFMPARAADGPPGAVCPHTGETIGRQPECIVLEGTAHLQNMNVESGSAAVPVVRAVPPPVAQQLVAGGARVLGLTREGLVAVEQHVLVTDMLAGLEGGVPWLSVENEATGRRTIPWVNLSSLSRRSHGHEFAGSVAEAAQQLITDELVQQHEASCFYQASAVMGNCLAISKRPGEVPSTDEWLGTFFPTFVPGKEGVRFQEPLAVPEGWTQEEFDEKQRYTVDRLIEVFEPPVGEQIEAGIAAHWLRPRAIAPERGEAVNAFLREHYCVTVGEASYEPAEQRRQFERAQALAVQANAELARQNFPHTLYAYQGIHSAFRTFVANKRAIAERHASAPPPGPVAARGGVQL
jgi:hypothetical protein